MTTPGRRLAAAALMTAVAGLLGVAPAAAASGADIDSVNASDDTVRVLVSLTDLQADTAPALGKVQATLDGEPVDSVAEPASDAEQQLSRITVLAIDTSASMEGERFDAAKLAALAFIENAPADVRIAVVGFADAAEVVVKPTRDRDALTGAVDSLVLSRETKLYAGISAATRLAETADSGSVLVLSDGKDTSGTAAGPLSEKLAASGVKVDVVALEQDATQLQLLGTLAKATGGMVIDAAEPGALTALFTERAAVLGAQVVVSFPVPEDWKGGDATLTVSVPVDGTVLTDEAFVNVPAPAPGPKAAGNKQPETAVLPPMDTSGGLSIPKPVMIAGVFGIGLSILVIAMAMTSRNAPEEATVADRLAAYTNRRRFGATSGAGSLPLGSAAGIKQSALDLSERALSTGRLEMKVAARLEAAGMKLNSAEWLLLQAGIAVAVPLGAFLFSGGNVVLALLVLPLAIAGPWFFLSRKHKKRIKRFGAQLPETLQLISGSLSAGLAFTQALDTVVREGSDPMASEFRRALVEARLGVNIEDALNGVAERMESEDFAWMVMAVKIQRDVGGNLAELLLTVAATLREREYLRRQVTTLSAEGRLSAWILGGMPPVFVGYLALVQPTYLAPMFSDPLGWLMMGSSAVLMAVGVFWLMKCVKVEI